MEAELKDIFQIVSDWLKFAEQKNAGLFAACFALAAWFLRLKEDVPPTQQDMCVVLFVSSIALTLAAVICLSSFLPRIRIPWIRQAGELRKDDNLVFYGDIAKYDTNQYLKHLGELLGKSDAPSTLSVAYAQQIVINSRIAVRKYKLFTLAAWITISAVVAPLLALIML